MKNVDFELKCEVAGFTKFVILFYRTFLPVLCISVSLGTTIKPYSYFNCFGFVMLYGFLSSMEKNFYKFFCKIFDKTIDVLATFEKAAASPRAQIQGQKYLNFLI